MKTLGTLGELRSGFQLRGAARDEPDGAHFLVQLGDLSEHGIEVRALKRMTLDRARERDWLRPGDVLVRGRGASYGAIPVHQAPAGAVAVAPIYVLRIQDPTVLPGYVACVLNLPENQAQLAAQARGTYIPTLTREALAALEVPFPPLEEQQRVLDLEALRREEVALTRALLAKREALVQEAVRRAAHRPRR